MTLVRVKEEHTTLPMMLTLQQHHSHHGFAGVNNGQAHHRGNVIVSTNSVPSHESKQQQQQQQQQQQHNCKRAKIYSQSNSPYGGVPHQPPSVARRNARERNRVKQVNNGFATLRSHIPQSVAQSMGVSTAAPSTHGSSRANNKKLSKVETLRMAVEYIRNLQRLLDDHDGGSDNSLASPNPATSTSSSPPSVSSTAEMSGDSMCHAELRLRSASTGSSDLHHRQSDIHHHRHHNQHLRPNASPNFMTTPCSEASSSPTPSFVSETSSAGSQGYGGNSHGNVYNNHPDNYDNYEPMSPEDEELLDAITWWQQSQ